MIVITLFFSSSFLSLPPLPPSRVEKLCFDVCSAILHFFLFSSARLKWKEGKRKKENGADMARVRASPENLFFPARHSSSTKTFSLHSSSALLTSCTRCFRLLLFIPIANALETHFFSQNFSPHPHGGGWKVFCHLLYL
jgi:hypothetical protein